MTVMSSKPQLGGLSARARTRLKELTPHEFPSPSGPYYDPKVHPEGVINLSTAENTLLTKNVLRLLNEGEIQSQHLKYRSTLLRSSLPQLEDLLPAYVSLGNPVRPVTRHNSVCGPGVGALIAHLVWALCDEGDGVLLSTPYYHDYARDIKYPGKAKVVLAEIPRTVDSLSPAVIPYLRDRISTAANEGTTVRCLLLCNPHNPIPRCYPVETIEGYISLAQEFGLHLIVDEIFAHSTYSTLDDPHPAPFMSILSLPIWNEDSPMLRQIHVLGGPTKDLGCSGIKAGILVTENIDVRRSVITALHATPISGATDAALTRILGDKAQLEYLLKENQRVLGEAMDLCAGWCKFHDFPYEGATAGVFFILDLSPIAVKLDLHGKEATVAIMRRMIDHGAHINPMDLDQDPNPHRFRFIFAHEKKTLTLALRRLEAAFGLEPAALGIENGIRQSNGHQTISAES